MGYNRKMWRNILRFGLLTCVCFMFYVSVRNERMGQLQHNGEVLSGNMKAQAERHAAELSSLREQVSLLQQESQHQKDLAVRRGMAAALPYAPHHERRAIRGGGADHQVHEVKTLRGGGGRPSHSPDEAQPWGGVGLLLEVKSPARSGAMNVPVGMGSTDGSGSGVAPGAGADGISTPVGGSPTTHGQRQSFLGRLAMFSARK
ncbi:unnamed protein product [Choristocarpus tenellus]